MVARENEDWDRRVFSKQLDYRTNQLLVDLVVLKEISSDQECIDVVLTREVQSMSECRQARFSQCIALDSELPESGAKLPICRMNESKHSSEGIR